MIKQVVSAILILALLIFSYTLIYQNLPQAPIEMKPHEIISEPITTINHGLAQVFEENLRFNHNNISYFIEPSCSNIQTASMKKAFQIFHEKMRIISFYEIDYKNADILVGCSEDFIELGDNFFAAGEGGPSKIIDTTNFKIIQEGEIFLYKNSRCERPVVEIHELCHVFGFDHTSNPDDIMYNISNCDQKITQDMIEFIKELYSIEPLPDAKISKLLAVKKGRYLDFNITVSNEGLTEVEDLSLTLIAKGETIETINLDHIGVGYTKTLSATNIKLPSMNLETIDFILDYESKIKELNEENNVIQMTIPSL